MKAIRIHNYRQPPSVDEVPEPDLETPHDVIVRVGGAGVCRTDLHLIDGWFEDVLPAERPFTLGHENAGWVEAVGDAVTNAKVGDTVIVHPLRTCGVCDACRRGEDMHCIAGLFPGVTVDGGYAEYLHTHERSVLVLPEGTEPAAVAPHADAGLTAFRAVRKASRALPAGSSAVVIGVGGLGHIAIQLLRELTPARIVAIDKSETGRSLARRAAVDAVLEPATAGELVGEITGGVGADVVIDFVGEGETPRAGVGMLRQGGSYFGVGYGGNLDLPTIELVLKEISIHGNLVGSYRDLEELMALVTAGRIELATRTYPLVDAVQALDDLDKGLIEGRGVLVPAS